MRSNNKLLSSSSCAGQTKPVAVRRCFFERVHSAKRFELFIILINIIIIVVIIITLSIVIVFFIQNNDYGYDFGNDNDDNR